MAASRFSFATSPSERAQQRLAAAQGYKGKIVAIVGHDIRSPLGAIALAAQLLERKLDASSPERKIVDRVTKAVDRIQQSSTTCSI